MPLFGRGKKAPIELLRIANEEEDTLKILARGGLSTLEAARGPLPDREKRITIKPPNQRRPLKPGEAPASRRRRGLIKLLVSRRGPWRLRQAPGG